MTQTYLQTPYWQQVTYCLWEMYPHCNIRLLSSYMYMYNQQALSSILTLLHHHIPGLMLYILLLPFYYVKSIWTLIRNAYTRLIKRWQPLCEQEWKCMTQYMYVWLLFHLAGWDLLLLSSFSSHTTIALRSFIIASWITHIVKRRQFNRYSLSWSDISYF